MKIHHNVRVNGMFLGAEAYILSSVILIVCYRKSRNFVILQNRLMLPLQAFLKPNLTLQSQSKRLVLIITKFCVVIETHREGVACYVRNDLSYNILSVFPREIENISFEILLPNSKGDFNINLYSNGFQFLNKKNIHNNKKQQVNSKSC